MKKKPFCKATALQVIKYLQKEKFITGAKLTAKAKCPVCSRLGKTCNTCNHKHGGSR